MYPRTGLLLAAPFLSLLAACGGERNEVPDDAQNAVQRETDTAPSAGLERAPSAPGARVYFVTPSDGDVVASPVTLEFGVEGMDVLPAGTEAANSGHHHVIIDSELPSMDTPIPADKQHVHFGDGSTQTTLDLDPGEHTLQLLFADYLHVPHRPPVASEQITVTVE